MSQGTAWREHTLISAAAGLGRTGTDTAQAVHAAGSTTHGSFVTHSGEEASMCTQPTWPPPSRLSHSRTVPSVDPVAKLPKSPALRGNRGEGQSRQVWADMACAGRSPAG